MATDPDRLRDIDHLIKPDDIGLDRGSQREHLEHRAQLVVAVGGAVEPLRFGLGGGVVGVEVGQGYQCDHLAAVGVEQHGCAGDGVEFLNRRGELFGDDMLDPDVDRQRDRVQAFLEGFIEVGLDPRLPEGVDIVKSDDV